MRISSTSVAATRRVLTSSQVDRLDSILRQLEVVVERGEALIDDLEHRFNHDSSG